MFILKFKHNQKKYNIDFINLFYHFNKKTIIFFLIGAGLFLAFLVIDILNKIKIIALYVLEIQTLKETIGVIWLIWFVFFVYNFIRFCARTFKNSKNHSIKEETATFTKSGVEFSHHYYGKQIAYWNSFDYAINLKNALFLIPKNPKTTLTIRFSAIEMGDFEFGEASKIIKSHLGLKN
tara:strand:+ start:953 stop:1489 length:537 start_codon:yes stop_codon:yes gene_type:complete